MEKEEPEYPYCAKLAKIRDFVKRKELPDAEEIRTELGMLLDTCISFTLDCECLS